MSVVFYNLITVTGPTADVHQFRKDARRRLSRQERELALLTSVPWSFEGLFYRHMLRAPASGMPYDAGHYFAYAEGTTAFDRWTRAKYSLEVKNFEIEELIKPLSRCYPRLCFVSSELSLDDASIGSYFIHNGRTRGPWVVPEKSRETHWRAAAESRNLTRDEAYMDDDAQSEAEHAMLEEALRHWDSHVRRVLVSRTRQRGTSGKRTHAVRRVPGRGTQPDARAKSPASGVVKPGSVAKRLVEGIVEHMRQSDPAVGARVRVGFWVYRPNRGRDHVWRWARVVKLCRASVKVRWERTFRFRPPTGGQVEYVMSSKAISPGPYRAGEISYVPYSALAS